ncbi:hypothetical protein [Streptomyces lavendulae]|uniref:hypothetical protein n=1 Tax=Streptomyces lavendulae TaxID=1914 RepID=UPI002552202C|nr:hypothetical protein [Streptomyces lavendulae]
MRAALTEQEIRDWGKVYREAVGSGAVDMLPAVITGRPVTSGYTFTDLKADFAPVAQEHAAQPIMSVVDQETLAAGGGVDSATFLNATREVGFGASAPRTVPSDELPPATSYRVKVELEKFHVVRAVGDAGGGKDEIYWCVTATSDKHKGPVFRSQEFGGVRQGNDYHFRPEPALRVVFDGAVSSGLALHIMCWEADQSTSEWYDKLQTAMQALCDQLFDTWQWQVGGMIGDPGLIGGVMLEVIGMIAWFISIWRNEDDLSCERGIVLDRQALAVLAHRGTSDWHFNGDGYHKLTVKYSGDKVPFPTGTLEYVVRSGSTWSAPVALPWKSITPPALASYKGKLYATFVRADQAVMWTRLENGAWKKPERVGGDQSYYAPALSVARNKLYYAVTGKNDYLYYRTYTEDGGWGEAASMHSTESPAMAPSLAMFQDEMWMTHVRDTGIPWLNIHNGSWRGAYQDTIWWSTRNPVGMANWGGYVWRIMRKSDDTVHFSRHGTSGGWKDLGQVSGWKTPSGMALAPYDNRLWVLLRDMDGVLRAANYYSSWSTTHFVGGSTPIRPMDEPAAAAHDGKLYVMYRR